MPALESSHAIAWLLDSPRPETDGVDVLTLSGRGDKDLDEALTKLGRRTGVPGSPSDD